MSDAAAEISRVFHLEPDALRCPYPAFDRLREDDPVWYSAELEAWVVSRYDDIVHVCRHPTTFSSRLPTGPIVAKRQSEAGHALFAAEPELAARMTRMTGRVLLDADPPAHGRQRRLVNRAFTPPKTKALEPRMREVAHGLVDGFAPRGEFELVHEFAVVLPLVIIAECLGVSEDDLPAFKRWSDDFVSTIGNLDVTTDVVRSLLVSRDEFITYFTERINERRAEPRDDLISDIVHATLDGEPLSDGDMLSMFIQFLVAGNETTTKLITSAVVELLRRPELLARVRAEPALLGGLVEEVLRLDSPVQGLYRTAVEDTEIGGVPIAAGQHLLLLYAAGNRDGRVFERAGELDPCRENSMKHLGFGHGEHYCLGSALARAEGRIGVEVLLERLDDIRLAPGLDLDELEYEPSYVLHGLKRLPLRFRTV